MRFRILLIEIVRIEFYMVAISRLITCSNTDC